MTNDERGMADLSPSQHWRLSQLNLEIERLESKAAELEADRVRLRRQVGQARRRLRYLRAAQATRGPAASFELWKVGLLSAGPIAIGLLVLLVADLLLPATVSGLLVFLVGAAAGLAVLALLNFHPADARLVADLEAAAGEAAERQARADDVAAELARVRADRNRLADERRELMASGQVQRAALLQRPWKSMGEIEWEDFVVEVCRTLGATVERRPAAAKLPPVLVMQLANRTVAAVTRGHGQVVDSSTVNLALQAREHCQAESAAVIINRRFTGAAQDLARRRGCTLVGVEEFPDFVLGKLEL
ncbi:MAG: hypothetical protein DCC67_04845 [Planctomycetota bacterium]|nr:MAG: hypothetical protein DCC67_04845 [Planctomycetota bacterium]